MLVGPFRSSAMLPRVNAAAAAATSGSCRSPPHTPHPALLATPPVGRHLGYNGTGLLDYWKGIIADCTKVSIARPCTLQSACWPSVQWA